MIGQVGTRHAKHPGLGLEVLYWKLQPEGTGYGVIKNEYLILRSLETIRQLWYHSRKAETENNIKRYHRILG